ncbi:MAG: ribonuclease VapC [Candidatus Aenigmarchaeota archaeon]|nr:ribonuclease VapC [Candidatus Aenigmarchaeota archaeon]
MRKVILDTNFLISSFFFKVDFLDEIKNLVGESLEFLTLDSVVSELNRIGETKRKDSKYAKLALKFLKQEKIKVIRSKAKNADEAILGVADENCIVATNDKELRKRLKTFKAKVIYLRAKKHLAIG